MKIIKKLVFCSFVFLALVIVGLGIQKNSDASLSRINFPVIGGELPSNVNYRLDPSISFSDEKFKLGNSGSEDYVFPFTNSLTNDEKVAKLKKDSTAKTMFFTILPLAIV